MLMDEKQRVGGGGETRLEALPTRWDVYFFEDEIDRIAHG